MRIWLLLCALVSTSALAETGLNKLPPGSRASLVTADLGGSELEVNHTQLFPPASTMKILTALAAKFELGDKFRFETRIERIGSEYVIRFSGDPTLTNEHLSALIRQAKAGGMTNPSNLYLDASIFTGYERGVGWPWDVLGVCYSAPASAITLDRNCVQASVKSLKSGRTQVYVPEHQPISVSTMAIALNKVAKKSRQCELELTTTKGNNYHLSGCMLKRDKPLPLKFALQDTYDYTRQVLERILKENGVKLRGQIRQRNVKQQGVMVASHRSEPLSDLLDTMLKKSDNLIADNLTKTLGAHFFHQPGSFNNGTEAIKQILYSHTGIDLEHAVLADGSGLSRNNRLTAQDMAQVLEYIWQNDEKLDFIRLLPVAGESGTLKYRRSMRQEPVKGHLQAKSGSLYGTYNMAGYVVDDKGQPQSLFVQFVSDYHPIKRDDAPKTPAPIYQFEQQFYNELVKTARGSGSPQ